MSFRLVKKIGDLERRNGPYMRYFTEFVYDVVVKPFFLFSVSKSTFNSL